MGRRYINDMMRFREEITYHVYEDGRQIGAGTRDKQEAKRLAGGAKGKVEIYKTRVRVPIDK